MNIMRFVATAILVVLGTVVAAQNITYDFDRTANFAAYKTYTWVRGAELADQLNHKRIVEAVGAQLAAKGLARIDAAANADVLVAYHASFDRNIEINGFSTGWGPYRFAGGSATARTEQILTGTLVVDIVDARTKTIVWRGIASKDVDPKADPAKRDRAIQRTAEKLFKNYPPVK